MKVREGCAVVSVNTTGNGSNAMPTSVLGRRGIAELLQRLNPLQFSGGTCSGQKCPESQFSSMYLTVRVRAAPPEEAYDALKSVS